jgi:hypothetical protein
MPKLCKYFNEGGCLKKDCMFVHEKSCTNKICVDAGKQHTHTFASCGQKGGGGHDVFIAKKREKAMAEKAAKRAAIDAARLPKVAVLEQIYPLVHAIMVERIQALREKYTIGPDPDAVSQKIVGMIADAHTIEELMNLLTNQSGISELTEDACKGISDYNNSLAPRTKEGEKLEEVD